MTALTALNDVTLTNETFEERESYFKTGGLPPIS
jgi:hypothetical protein